MLGLPARTVHTRVSLVKSRASQICKGGIRSSSPSPACYSYSISALSLQSRAGQGRAGQGRAGQGRAGQGRSPQAQGSDRTRGNSELISLATSAKS